MIATVPELVALPRLYAPRMSVGPYPFGPLLASGFPDPSRTTRARHAAKPAWAAGQVRALPCQARAAGDADEFGAASTAPNRAAPTVAASARRLIDPPGG